MQSSRGVSVALGVRRCFPGPRHPEPRAAATYYGARGSFSGTRLFSAHSPGVIVVCCQAVAAHAYVAAATPRRALPPRSTEGTPASQITYPNHFARRSMPRSLPRRRRLTRQSRRNVSQGAKPKRPTQYGKIGTTSPSRSALNAVSWVGLSHCAKAAAHKRSGGCSRGTPIGSPAPGVP